MPSGPVIIIEYNGEPMRLKELSQRCGISAKILYDRIRRGMSVEEAANTPVHSVPQPKYPYKDEMVTMRTMAKRTGIPGRVLLGRIGLGYTLEEAVSMPYRGGYCKPIEGMPDAVAEFINAEFHNYRMAKRFLPREESWEWRATATAETARVSAQGDELLLEYGLNGRTYVKRRSTI